MITIMQPLPDIDEPPRRQADVVSKLNDRLNKLAGITTMREISAGGALRLDAPDLGSDARDALAPEQMEEIVNRATFLLSSFYVHLSAKRSLHASDPLQALRNLRMALGVTEPALEEEEFHDRMTAIFVGLHDRHTNYYLPSPYRRTIAFLPFLIEPAIDPNTATRRFLVTKLAVEPAEHDVFRVGGANPVEVTHLNGVPIEQVVARHAAESAGANPGAREARGVDRLTFRWLGLGTGPREDWVDVRFTIAGEAYQQRFEWLAARQLTNRLKAEHDLPGTGQDAEGEWIRLVKKELYFKPRKDGVWKEIQGGIAEYRDYPGAPGAPDYGYLRIFSFEVPPADVPAFVRSVAGVLRSAPEGGLVIDIRGNPGGNVEAAEALLPLFSATPVKRQGVQFLNTPEALELAVTQLRDAVVHDPSHSAAATAAPFVVFPEMPLATPLKPAAQVYQGGVVVIVDGNSYSAGEMFAAGMEDNFLATIIGTHFQSGGGGAILWSDEGIAKACGSRSRIGKQLAPLPGGASFDVAVLRTTRAGNCAGVAMEDMGVVISDRNRRHQLTVRDVLGSNEDLRDVAYKALVNKSPWPFVSADYDRGVFTLRTGQLKRLDVWVDGAPRQTFSHPKIPTKLRALVRRPAGRVIFRGVVDNEVVAEYHVTRRTSEPAAAPPAPALPEPAAPAAPQDREV